MNIKLIKTIEAENKRTDRYEIDDLYIVDATYYDNEFFHVSIQRNPWHNFLPDIYYLNSYITKNPAFEIKTCAFGLLSPDNIRKVIKGYETAIEAQALLEKTFLS